MIQAGQPISASDYINSTENAGSSADNGKVVKLETVEGEGGKISKEFLKITNPVVRTYLNSGSPHTWTKPTGLSYIIVEVQACGGNGGSVTDTDSGAGGGGAGGYSRKLILVGSLSATETVTVGANGANSSFGSFITCVSGGNVASNSEDGGAGGSASGGDINIDGQTGGTGSDEDTWRAFGGQGGGSKLGIGGTSVQLARDGRSGTGYGAGGGGSSTSGTANQTGGTGSPAIVIVTEYYN